jgi:asparagine synthase (glutamine-hydrolysing)
MCGIIGYIGPHSISLEEGLNVIRHRGPDNQASSHSKCGQFHVGLGHVRLSIIDLDKLADQPFSSEDGQVIMSYNGEIYNFRELREKHLAGISCRTKSDTEVILQLYLLYGKEMLSWLQGMFAIVILDKRQGKLLLARDALGIKPLYYSYSNRELFFSSEIRGLKAMGVRPVVDETAIAEFIMNGFIYEPNTGLKNVNKVLPGSYISFDFTGETIRPQEVRYWVPGKKEPASEQQLGQLVESSIKSHLISDVPVGLFFSGGVDSSIMLANLRNSVKSLVVKFSESANQKAGNTDDYYYAKKIAKHLQVENMIVIEQSEEQLSGSEFLHHIKLLCGQNEELISNYTYSSSALISEKARDSNIIVALSGMGADEFFGGYPRYLLMRYYSWLKLMGQAKLYRLVSLALSKSTYFSKKIERFNSFFEEDKFIFQYTSLVGPFSRKELQKLLLPKYAKSNIFEAKLHKILEGHERESPLKKAMLLDLYGFLSHNFTVADKSSMSASIELRVPLATKEIFDYCFSSSDSSLVKGWITKASLKELLCQVLPKKLVYRTKTGFNPPMDAFIGKLSREDINEFLEGNSLFKICSKPYVASLLEEHFEKRKNHTLKIFNLLYLASWVKNNSI